MSKARLTEGPEQGKTPSFLFDLDGTLLDSAYEHVMAWREALTRRGHLCTECQDSPMRRDERQTDAPYDFQGIGQEARPTPYGASRSNPQDEI